jgi:hypothetical protein
VFADNKAKVPLPLLIKVWLPLNTPEMLNVPDATETVAKLTLPDPEVVKVVPPVPVKVPLEVKVAALATVIAELLVTETAPEVEIEPAAESVPPPSLITGALPVPMLLFELTCSVPALILVPPE